MNARGVAAACLAGSALVLLAGCGKGEPTTTDPAAEQKAAAERARQGPFGTQLKALDTAKGMQADLNRKAQEEGTRADEMSK